MRFLALPIVVLLGAAPASAQSGGDPAGEARELFDEAIAAIQRDDYPAALTAFQLSWGLNQKPVTLFNIGMCQRAMADLPAAYETLRRYLDGGQDEDAARREEAGRVLAELDVVLARVTVLPSEPGAEVSVDGRALGPAAPGEPVRVVAGTHVFEARAAGFEAAREVVDVMAGESLEVRLDLSPAEDGGSGGGGAVDDGGIVTKWWFWTILGAVVVGGGVTAGVLLWPDDERLPATWTVHFD